MTLYFFLCGLAALIVLAILENFSGRLAKRLGLYAMLVVGLSFLATALLLIMTEPWEAPEQLPPTTGIHRPSTVALYVALLFVAYGGPQITGLILAAISAYILHTVYIARGRFK